MRAIGIGLGLAMTWVATMVPALALDDIGTVERVEVWAYGTPPQMQQRDLFTSNPVYGSERVRTVRTGALSLRFVDGTRLALGSDSTLVLDTMVYDPSGKQSFVANLGAGVFHLLSGGINKEAVTIVTPTMTIGLRGTELGIKIGADGTTTLIVLSGGATSTPVGGGKTVDVGVGQTATATPGATSISVSNNMAFGLLANLPTVGPGHGGNGGSSGRQTPATTRSASASGPSSGSSAGSGTSSGSGTSTGSNSNQHTCDE